MFQLLIRTLLCFIGCCLLINAVSNPQRPSFVEQRSLLPLKLDVPVFSLATINEDGTTNMNIVTYATQVGIKPKPVYAISLYKGTVSHENFIRTRKGALQLLSASAFNIVPLLGKQSGRDVDKMKLLQELTSLCRIRLTEQGSENEKDETDEICVIQDSPMILIAEYPGHEYQPLDVGDHQVFLCDIVRSVSVTVSNDDTGNIIDEESRQSSLPYLTTQVLRSMNII